MTEVDFERLFDPRGIAVVGASQNQFLGATQFLQTLIDMKYEGELYPVNPKYAEVLGLKAYPRVADIPGPVDHVIIGVPAEATIQVIEDCVEKGVRSAHLFTSGFSELGTREGMELQRRLVQTARGKVRIIGPNCMGIYCPRSRMGFAFDQPTETGEIAFLSQSGGHAIHFVKAATSRGLRLSKAVSLGNASDLKIEDFLEYLGTDPETKIIGMYVEGLIDGRRFFKVAREVARRKPVIVWKAGRTKAGTRTLASHTGSLAGSFDLWLSAARQIGFMMVSSNDEMIDVMHALTMVSPPIGRRVGVITTGGGNSVAFADLCESIGLDVPELERATQQEMVPVIGPVGTISRNPVDPSAASFNPETIKKVMISVAKDPNIDVILFCREMLMSGPANARIVVSDLHEGLIRTLRETLPDVHKPVFFALSKGIDSVEMEAHKIDLAEQVKELGLPVFPSVERAARAIFALMLYSRKLIHE